MDAQEQVPNTMQMVLDTILERLDRQDVALAALPEMRRLIESVTTRQHDQDGRMDEMERQRERLLEEAGMYKREIETRMAAVEARDAITEIRQTVTDVQAAIALQLAIHRWWTHHKVRSRCAIAAAAVSPGLFVLIVQLAAKHFGLI
jgi:hypothetical protein